MMAQRIDRPSKKYRILGYPKDSTTGESIKTHFMAEQIEPHEQRPDRYAVYIFKDWEKIAEELGKDGKK